MNKIFRYIVEILTPSIFENDDERTVIARTLHIILMLLLGAIVIALLLAFSGRATITNQVFFNLSVIIGPIIIVSLLVTLRKGYVEFVAWTFVAFQWFTTVVQVIGSNGLESPALGAFTVTLLLAGFLINRRGVVIFGSLSVVSILVIGYLDSMGQIPPPLVFSSPAAKLLIVLTLMGVATTLLYMVMRRLQKALESTRSYALELEQVVQQKTRAEEEILLLNAQLQNQVAELERFTYTVSHDLRSPLVTIKGFLGMLSRDMKKNRQDKIQHDFERISNATDKMDDLLTDLLELSRIGRIVNPPREIDTHRLIQDALDSVDAHIRSRNVSVNIAPDLPNIYGDPTRLREVFENLIDNAVKYMGEQAVPVVELGVRGQEKQPIFYVKDNGMGIEEQYHEKIFGLFETLNPNIEGTGIGLALIKRIIETHGGKIWVESEGPGKGSTFCFTLPNKSV
ncbi:MAG TPA: ATP-binding protein [Anaerolineales bacterium]|nr:ATP-binding protein [Anaerolineales bacterium]